MSETTYTRLTPEVYRVPVPFQNTVVFELMSRYGEIETYETIKGAQITLLPSCTVDIKQLQPDNWFPPLDFGNFRSVKHIQRLQDGTPTGLFVKSPERIFTTVPRLLERGDVWWGGPRSGEKLIRLRHNSIVEEQTMWEALTLLELLDKEFHAEVPQAIIMGANGENSLVVSEIPTTSHTIKLQGRNDQDLSRAVRTLTSLSPEDFTRQNCLVDLQGYLHIIDVNRWSWPPHTDHYRSALKKEILDALRN